MQVQSHLQDHCFHCGEILPEQDVLYLSMDSERRAMCCAGCKSVAEFIVNAGLSDYYKHRKELPDKIDSASLMQSTDWQAFDRANFDSRIGPDVHEVILDIEGLHCVSCSWLVKNKLENQCEIKVISLDHQTGIAVIQWDKNKTPLSSILHSINSLGYLPHVLDQENGELQQELSDQNSENSLKRLVVAGLGMMQVMMFAVALYTGNEQNMENVYRRFLIWVSMLVSFPVLFYSGMPFLRHAWQSIRLHRMHMDIPIAIAMLSAFSLSVVNSFSGTGEVYFDSVVMFVFFLSVSRYIQEQVSRKMLNSRQALARMLPVFVEIEENGQLLKKPLTEIKLGEKIAIPIGAVIPADGVINSGRTEIDASSLSGESRPLVCKQGDAVFAGMRNLGQPISITTTAITKHSALSVLSQRLKRAKFTSEQNQLSLTRYVTAFIAFTLLLATCVFIYWNLHRDWQYGFEIALAVLVVSCPCALSIALPSGVASLTRYLHKQGLYVINPYKLFKLTQIDTVIFDKTGTLTNPEAIMHSALNDQQTGKYLDYAQALSLFTQHPKARFLHKKVNAHSVTGIKETVGSGVSGVIDGKRYYLGKDSFVTKHSVNSNNETVYSLYFGDGEKILLQWQQQEILRPGTRNLLDSLKASGMTIIVASGDRTAAVKDLTQKLVIDDFYAEQSSRQKLELLRSLQSSGKTVMCIGDGINDAEFLQQADLSISFTGASELAQAQADILMAGTDFSGIKDLLNSARHLKTIYQQNLAWAISYNALMLPLAVLGYIQPWIAALGMSLSSLFVVLNSLRLSKRQNKTLPDQLIEASVI